MAGSGCPGGDEKSRVAQAFERVAVGEEGSDRDREKTEGDDEMIWWTRKKVDPDYLVRLSYEATRKYDPEAIISWDDLPEDRKEEMRESYRMFASRLF